MSLEIVNLRNNILNDYKTSEIKNKIINRIVELNLNNHKYIFDNEFLLLICNLIEHLVFKKDKINKLDLVCDIYKTLFNLSSEDNEKLKLNVNFIHSNKQIKKISYWKLFKCGLKEFFFKK